MKKRILYLDELRLFAILCIILLHSLSLFRYFCFDNNTFDFTFWTIFDSLTRIGLPIFFMLTGILMFQKKDEDYLEFFKKRVLRLIIAYIIFYFIYYFYDVLINHYAFSLYEYVYSMTTGAVIYHLWFMPVIIMIYLFLPFLKKLVLSLNKKELEILIILIFLLGNCLVGLRAILELRNYDLMWSFTLPSLIIYTNYLFIGYYLYKYEIKLNYKIIIPSIISLILMTVLTLVVSRESVNDIFLNSQSPLVVLPSCLVFLLFKKNKDKTIPSWLDNFMLKHNSDIFYVYLLHALVISIIKTIFKIPSANSNLLIDILITILLFVATTIISFFIVWLWNIIKNLFKNKKHN